MSLSEDDRYAYNRAEHAHAERQSAWLHTNDPEYKGWQEAEHDEQSSESATKTKSSSYAG